MNTQNGQQQNGRAPQQGRAIVKAGNDKFDTLQSLFERSKKKMAGIMPAHLTPEKLTRLVLSAASRTPKLLDCTPTSILLSSLQSAALGLEPNTPLGHAYLVPHFNGKTKQLEATFIPGYRGLITLAIQSGEIKSVQARVVREGDFFEVEMGLEERLVHRPLLSNERRPLFAVYSVAVFTNGAKTFEVMPGGEIDFIRSLSKSANVGPWVDHYDEMAKKTVIRRHAKVMPMSVDKAQGFMRALQAQARAEDGDGPDFSDVLEDLGESEEELGAAPKAAQLPQSRTSALEGKLAPDERKSDPAAARPVAGPGEPPIGALADDAPMAGSKGREPGSEG